ncbi:MAG TPA: hypothetical protein VFZ08_14235, partial [Terriglobia bacterium]|nr:hypothetical protein [Terriglobia bacterium]
MRVDLRRLRLADPAQAAVPLDLPFALDIGPLGYTLARCFQAILVIFRFSLFLMWPNSGILARPSVLSFFLAGTASGSSLRPADARSASG